MTDAEYKALYSKAKAFAKAKRGLSDQEAEDFAQEFVIKTLEKGKPLRVDYQYSNYRKRNRANKRILGNAEVQFRASGQFSIDAPISESEGDGSAKFSDVVGMPGSDVGCGGGTYQDFTAGEKLDEQVGLFLSTIGLDERTIEWANQTLRQSLGLRKQRILMKEKRRFKRLTTSLVWGKPSVSSKK